MKSQNIKKITNYNYRTATRNLYFITPTPINLSSMLYLKVDELSETKLFNILNVLKPEKMFKIKRTGIEFKQYTITFHPEILKLASAFDYDNHIYNSTIITAFNKKTLKEQYKELIGNLFEKIIEFYTDRIKILQKNELNLIKKYNRVYFDVDFDEFSEIYKDIKNTTGKRTIDIIDFKSMTSTKKEEYSVTVREIFNFQSLKNYLENMISYENEYYNPTSLLTYFKEKAAKCEPSNKRKIDVLNTAIRMANRSIDRINSNPYFNVDNIDKLINALYDLIRKEQAMESFIYKILNTK
jgi:hypothetical protein